MHMWLIFFMNALRAPIGQGYGLTETCAGATFTEPDDPNVGHVGPPLPCAYIKVCDTANNDERDDCVSLSDNRKLLEEDLACFVVALEPILCSSPVLMET